MKKLSLLFLTCLIVLLPVTFANADDVSQDTYSIHIIKYQLDASVRLPESIASDGTKQEIVTDDKGNKLKTMAGMHYDIIKLQLKEDATNDSDLASYIPATNSNAFSMTIMTNIDGEASANGLPEGVYEVREQPNEKISRAMEPVLVKLPLTTEHGVLNEVFLYPKSSVIDDVKTENVNKLNKLPQTSGSIGSNHRIIFLLSLCGLMGLLGLMRFRKKQP